MAVIISGNGIDMGNNPVSNASQIDGVVMNENGDNVATTSNLVGFKNYIINGGFDVWQRGTSFPITTVSNTYTADRMYITLHQITSGTLTVERNTFNKDTSANYCLELNASTLATTSPISVTQIIESLSAKKLAGKTVTLSLKAKVLSGTANCSMDVIEGTNIDAFPTGGATTRNNITLTTSYQTFTLKVNVASATTSIAFRFNTPNAFNGVVYIQNIQLEEGSVATPFEQRPYGLELSLCQRYYEVGYIDESYNYSGAVNNIGTGTKYKNTKRVVPTVTLTYGTLYQNRNDGFAMYGNIGIGQWLYNTSFTANAEL